MAWVAGDVHLLPLDRGIDVRTNALTLLAAVPLACRREQSERGRGAGKGQAWQPGTARREGRHCQGRWLPKSDQPFSLHNAGRLPWLSAEAKAGRLLTQVGLSAGILTDQPEAMRLRISPWLTLGHCVQVALAALFEAAHVELALALREFLGW